MDNIIINKTLEQYNKKYKNRTHRLLKYSKKQVDDFDKKYGFYDFNNKNFKLKDQHYLLKNRKWALIGDKYYEIPKAPRLTWFRNLNTAAQVGISLLGVGVISTSIAVPIVMQKPSATPEEQFDIEIDKSKFEDVVITKGDKFVDIKLKTKSVSDDKITSIKNVKIGDKELSKDEYTYDEASFILKINNDIVHKYGDKKITVVAKALNKVKFDKTKTQNFNVSNHTTTTFVLENNNENEFNWSISNTKLGTFDGATFTPDINEGGCSAYVVAENETDKAYADVEVSSSGLVDLSNEDSSGEGLCCEGGSKHTTRTKFEGTFYVPKRYYSTLTNSYRNVVSCMSITGLFKLKKLVIPSSVKYLRNSNDTRCFPFLGSQLTDGKTAEIELNEGLESVEERSFTNGNIVKTITIPSSVKKFGESVFSLCKLDKVIFTDSTSNWTIREYQNNELKQTIEHYNPTNDSVEKNYLTYFNFKSGGGSANYFYTWDKEI